MGWGSGINKQGREVGYNIEAECDFFGCKRMIDRGLYYCCGGRHDGGEHGCGNYYCGEHLFIAERNPVFLCSSCSEIEELQPEDIYEHLSKNEET